MKLALLLVTTISLTIRAQAANPSQAYAPQKRVENRAVAVANEHEAENEQLLSRGAEFQRAGQNEVALQFYRQAALAGSKEGAFLAGTLNWQTAATAKGKSKVLKLDAGLRLFYQAATNGHAKACLSLSQAYHDGLGVKTNLTQAYAWLLIAKHFDPSIPLQLLDQLAVELDAPTLHQAQENAEHWLAEGWPGTGVSEIIQGDPRFKINGFSRGSLTNVMINRKTLVPGESAPLTPLVQTESNGKPTTGNIEVICTAIGEDYVLLKVAGEENLRLLAIDVN